MGLPALLGSFRARLRQRRLVRDIAASSVRYSDSLGQSIDDRVVVTGAGHDLVGTAAIFAWMISHFGFQGIDWQLLGKSGAHRGEERIDIYHIQLRSGEERTLYFDVTESWGKWDESPPE